MCETSLFYHVKNAFYFKTLEKVKHYKCVINMLHSRKTCVVIFFNLKAEIVFFYFTGLGTISDL